MPYSGDEIHHSGWNVCSSCHGDKDLCRDKMILPCVVSDRIYIVDMSNDPKAPVLHKTIEAESLHELGLATPHTTHCLPTGEVMISTMGKPDGSGQGSFLLLDGAKDFKVKGRQSVINSLPNFNLACQITLNCSLGTWSSDTTAFGYDFWYQPYFDVFISTQWGAPKAFKAGFNLEDVIEG